MKRIDGRTAAELRPVNITRDYLDYAEGSVLIEFGRTKVLCAASVEEKVPPFLKGSGQGWVTAEYALLPRSTANRTIREAAKGKLTGRTQEIQRLIGRSLRSVVNMKALGERTLWLDCDVIQADGGTRTAAITGAFVAMTDAISRLGGLEVFPIRDFVAAASVGLVQNECLLDLCYVEDSQAEVDMNLVMTGRGEFIEIQGTGEQRPFSAQHLACFLELGQFGVEQLIALQKQVLGKTAGKIGSEA